MSREVILRLFAFWYSKSFSSENGPKRVVFPGAPSTFVEPGHKGRYIFSQTMARRFLAHRAAMEQVEAVAAEYLGMGKTKLYELTREDEHDVILARPFRMV